MEPIVSGFKYLGYYLKPLGYKVSDWNWLVQKFENRIFHWAHKLLSRGGRLILVQAVLSSIPVYWLGLAPIPVSMSNQLRSLKFAFYGALQETNTGIIYPIGSTFSGQKRMVVGT